MTKKKTTKQIRAIDRIIKFQIDDGIESLTIGGKEALADLEIDRNSNVTLYVNADKDKVNEIKSLVPFVNVAVKETGTDPDKSKAVTLSQDLTKFALELAEDSKQLAEIIKAETSLTIDFAQLITRLNNLSTAVDKTERNSAKALAKAEKVEREQVEQGNQLANLLTKDQEQDNQLNEIILTQETHRNKLANIEQGNEVTNQELQNHQTRLLNLETNSSQPTSQLYNVTHAIYKDNASNTNGGTFTIDVPTTAVVDVIIATPRGKERFTLFGSETISGTRNMFTETVNITSGRYLITLKKENGLFDGNIFFHSVAYHTKPFSRDIHRMMIELP